MQKRTVRVFVELGGESGRWYGLDMPSELLWEFGYDWVSYLLVLLKRHSSLGGQFIGQDEASKSATHIQSGV